MPAVQPPCKVLVSGATGYIAAWVVQNLLERGYSVRGTARSVAKGEHLKKVFAPYGDKFEVVVVEDISQDGAFDEAVKGVDAIEHTASPFHMNAVDPDELIKPAVNGTVGMLKSVLKDESTKVKRVVITSSGAAVLREEPTQLTFTEADWNTQCLEVLKKFKDEGRKNEAPNMMKYRASKTLAERSAWEFVNDPENKLRIKWDLAVLNPPFVFGPAIHEITTPSSLNTSAAIFYNYVADGAKANAAGNDFLANTGTCWIDVRDLAEAHALALEKEAAGGERIIVSGGEWLWKWQDFIDAANDLNPPPKLSTTLPVGIRGAGKTAKHLTIYSTAKADRILGLKYRSIAETTKDTFGDYETRGW
ncbi:NAD(P)-binding protein [Paxillus ammoniavirescens]|nr:NAD(P)-binding protein [Paxillus ammoniavirescens]